MLNLAREVEILILSLHRRGESPIRFRGLGGKKEVKVDKEIERDDGRKSKQTMIDTSIFLSTTSHSISKKWTLISRITTNPTSFFHSYEGR